MSSKHLKFDQFPQFGVLSDVKVLVSGLVIAGPYAGMMMAEMGAQVVQIEPPKSMCQTRGDYGFIQNHRNSFSLTLDINTDRGKEVFEKAIEWADIWIESGRPGNYAKRGLTDEYLWTINKKLAIVHVSGYGQYGPIKDKASYDVSGQAMGGYMYLNGTSPTSSPLRVNPYTSDFITAFNACICALSIHVHALKTGEGDSADIAQYEHMFRILEGYPMEWFNRGFPAPGQPVHYRTGNKSSKACGFSFYDCKDGNTIFIGMAGKGPVERGYPLVGLPAPGSDPEIPLGTTGFLASLPIGQRVDAAIAKFCAERTVDEVEAIMNENGIPNQKAYTPADILKDEQYAARECITTWEDPIYGEVKGIGIINKFTKNPGQIVSASPLFGEHNREIIKSFGFSDEYVDEMYKNGEIAELDAVGLAKRWRLKEWGFFWNEEQSKRLGL